MSGTKSPSDKYRALCFILISQKVCIESTEHFVVARDRVVYLRIAGEEGDYKIMTATAGEGYQGLIF